MGDLRIQPSTNLNDDLRDFSRRIARYQEKGINSWWAQFGAEDRVLRNLTVSLARRINDIDESVFIILKTTCDCPCHTTDLMHPQDICPCQR